MIRRFLARRRLAKLVAKTKAQNHDWALHRLAQLSGERRARFAEVIRG